MTFVDTNVFMYAVGRPHALRDPARTFFTEAVAHARELVTSAEVLRELVHAYVPVDRRQTLDDALALVERSGTEVWPLQPEDVLYARRLLDERPGLGARDACHLACCLRRRVTRLETFDRTLAEVAGQVL